MNTRGSKNIIGTSVGANFHAIKDMCNYLDYIHEFMGIENLRLLFIGLANNDSKLDRFLFSTLIKIKYPKWEFNYITKEDVEYYNYNIINYCDFVFIDGGDIHQLMDAFSSETFKEKLIRAYDFGVCMGGINSGLCCWFKEMLNKEPEYVHVQKGLGVIDFSICTNYENDKKQRYDDMIDDKLIGTGYGVPNGAIVHFHNGDMYNPTRNGEDINKFLGRDTIIKILGGK
jgi:peptidase E